jgi:FHS family L-fucose permease-like MFS transporter
VQFAHYVAVAVGAIAIAVIFSFANVPDIRTEDDYHLDDSTPGALHSIWSHPHFVMAVAAQFFYVAAQAGIFSFFINYMTAETPPSPASWAASSLAAWFETAKTGAIALSDKGAANLASLAFGCCGTRHAIGAAQEVLRPQGARALRRDQRDRVSRGFLQARMGERGVRVP